jgi:hypothetical protein
MLYTIESSAYRTINDCIDGEQKGFINGAAYYLAKSFGLPNQKAVDNLLDKYSITLDVLDRNWKTVYDLENIGTNFRCDNIIYCMMIKTILSSEVNSSVAISVFQSKFQNEWAGNEIYQRNSRLFGNIFGYYSRINFDEFFNDVPLLKNRIEYNSVGDAFRVVR